VAFDDLSFLPTACALSRGCIFDISKRWQKLDAVCQLTPYSIPSGSGQKNDEEGNAEQGSVRRPPTSFIYS